MPLQEFGIAGAITLGCTLFILTGDVKARPHGRAGSGGSAAALSPALALLLGVAYMVGYLTFDGFTSTYQDKMFKG